MISFPDITMIHRRMPKEAFYKHLDLSTAMKEKFVSDVDRIYIENSLTVDNLNLTVESDVKEIILLSVSLKKQDFDGRVIEAIAKQNPHKLMFLIIFNEERQLALYQGKLYRTEWMPENEITLDAHGFSLQEIWESMIEQIALYEEKVEYSDGLTIEQRLALQEQIAKLEKQIERTEASAWKEQQPKKRFELYTRVQTYKKKLEELKRGQT